MFNTFAHTAIDAIQNSKKQVVATFVQHQSLKDILNQYIDTQSKYTKEVVTNSVDLLTAAGAIMSSKDFQNQYLKLFTPGKGK